MKLDNLQPSGSFKIRGIGQTCLQAKQSGATTIVGSSGGNAGKAMAYAAKKLNLKAVLFIPTSTPQMMIEKIKVSNRNSGTGIVNITLELPFDCTTLILSIIFRQKGQKFML